MFSLKQLANLVNTMICVVEVVRVNAQPTGADISSGQVEVVVIVFVGGVTSVQHASVTSLQHASVTSLQHASVTSLQHAM